MQTPSPLHTSAVQTVLSLFSQLVPAGQLGCWQALSVPLQTSFVQGFKSSGHGVPFAMTLSAGHAALDPVQVSATSQESAAARQIAPMFPAGCWHVTWVPSHWSSVQGLPSEVHAAPLVFFASAGHAPPAVPRQLSATSHSPAAVRHTKVLGLNTSVGQLALVPVHTSSGSHVSPEPARHSAPAFPAGCWQATLVPSHWSRVQGLPSEVHAVPLVFFASAGHAPPAVPGQFSATSHSPPAVRHTKLLGWTTSAGQLALVPVHTSSGSQASPEPARHSAPPFPAGCWQATLVPSHWSSVHGLPSSLQPVPAGSTVSGPQPELGGASAMSWLICAVAVLAPPVVDAFEPVAPGLACDASALSEDASVVVPPELELSTLNRSVIPDGAPIALWSERPKQATSMVL